MLEIKRTQLQNPYIAGKALGQDRGFFGREDVFDMVASEMLSADRNAIVLFGQRRIGKTSILLQLQRRLPTNLFLPIYFDLMDHASVTLGRLLFDLASAMRAGVVMPPLDREQFDEEGEFFRHNFLPAFYEAAGPERRPVVLFDEFDVLAADDERILSPNSAGRSFFPYIRRLLEGEPRLGFVFVAGRKAEELTMDVKAAFKTARYKRISVLDESSARKLIQIAEQQGSLTFGSAAVERILAMTSGHPYFTQLLCQLVWDDLHAHPSAAARVPKVEASDIDAVMAKAPEAGENICEWIWDGLPPAEKVIYAAIAQATETRPFVTSGEVIEVLQRHGVRFLTRELELAPETLVKWEMLREKDGRYAFFIELMRRWVASRKPVPKVKDELDRSVPLADNLYQSGDGFYRRGNLDNSQALLQQALTVNPNHLKARLLLGQVLIEQGKLEDAVRELEEAHRYDESSAHYPLVRTLLLREDELRRQGNTDGALTICERVLSLAPGNAVANDRRTAIWKARGESAVAQGRLDDALAAFKKIDANELLEEVIARKLKIEVDHVSKTAQSQMDSERWDIAGDLYKHLAALEPGVKTWTDRLARCQSEQRFAKLYADALQAINQEQWRKAQTFLIELVGARPDYKDANDLLFRALKPPLPPAPPVKEPVAGPFLRLYLKCAIALTVCVGSGLLRVHSGSGDPATSVGFYLGVAVVLALVLGVIELGSYLWTNRREPIQGSVFKTQTESRG